MTDQNAIVVSAPNYLAPAAGLNNVLLAYQAKKEFIGRVLAENVDYGTIPGAGDKPALKKPGAEKLASFFGLSPVFEDVTTVEDWTGSDHNGEPFFYYRQKCKLYRGDWLVATADGSCNSWEKKYRYRNGERVCPKCGKAAIIVGKKEYGGGFICFAKKGGCGAKFGDNAPEITGQSVGQVINPDVAEQVNTILKMAQKRALVAAVLIATNASDYFTQDVDDFFKQDEWVEAQVTVVQPTPQERADQAAADLGFAPAPTALDLAKTVTASDGRQYGDMTTEELSHHANGIADGLKKNISPEKRKELEHKRDAIALIIKSRQ